MPPSPLTAPPAVPYNDATECDSAAANRRDYWPQSGERSSRLWGPGMGKQSERNISHFIQHRRYKSGKTDGTRIGLHQGVLQSNGKGMCLWKKSSPTIWVSLYTGLIKLRELVWFGSDLLKTPVPEPSTQK